MNKANAENRPEENRAQLRMFVLDVLQHDIEPLSSIIKMLNDTECIGWRNFWPHDFRPEEVVDALKDAFDRGWVKVLVDSPTEGALVEAPLPANFTDNPSDFWFKLTNDGKRAWVDWQPPEESEG